MEPTEFVPKAGGCIVSRRILNGTALLRWAFREEGQDPRDNGWRFFSDADDDAYLANPANLAVCDFNTVASIEPAVLGICHLPFGSDLQLAEGEDGKAFFDNSTGRALIYRDGRFDFA